MKSQPHKSLLAIAFVSVVVVALAYGYLYKTIDISTENIAKTRADIQSEESLKSQSKSISSLFESTASNRAKVRASVVDSEKVVDLIVAVESLGSRSGSKVTIINITSQKNEVYMNVSATGSWSSVMRTLVMAESLPYASAMDSLRLDASDKGVWSMNFKLRALTI